MGMRMTTPISEVNAYLSSEAERIHRLTVRALASLGEQCVRLARDRAPELSWIDQTGNLRSSIGYIITHNGNILRYSDFKQVKRGSEGTKTGKDFAEEIANQFSNEYVLVVVAGMNYAEFVEARENKDVLATPELFVKKELPIMIEKLKRQIAK